jgi:hypothetical protein
MINLFANFLETQGAHGVPNPIISSITSQTCGITNVVVGKVKVFLFDINTLESIPTIDFDGFLFYFLTSSTIFAHPQRDNCSPSF